MQGKKMNAVAAKQFLIARVIEEAELQQVLLSDLEKKMLYFTEVHPSLPDIYEINAEFERNYDAAEYADKVAALLRNARDRDSGPSPVREQEWKDALARRAEAGGSLHLGHGSTSFWGRFSGKWREAAPRSSYLRRHRGRPRSDCDSGIHVEDWALRRCP
jgi:hypothetical protein